MKTIRWFGIALLFFLAVSAIMGSIPMIAEPHGMPWGMPQALLLHSPFDSFLVPGIVLLGANGLLAAWGLCLAAARRPHYGLWEVLQGCVLLGWLVVECIMLRLVAWPHYVYGTVALGLIGCGVLLWRDGSRALPWGEGI